MLVVRASESMWHSKACWWLDHTPNVLKIGAHVRSAHGQGIQSLVQEPILLGLGKQKNHKLSLSWQK
jgi:hypothetical protein